MKKIIKFIKNNILGFLVGLSLCLNGVVIAENIITANQVKYKDSTVQTELDSLFDAVDINEKLGDTSKISNIGDGTISGAINKLQNYMLSSFNTNITKVKIVHLEYGGYTDIFSYTPSTDTLVTVQCGSDLSSMANFNGTFSTQLYGTGEVNHAVSINPYVANLGGITNTLKSTFLAKAGKTYKIRLSQALDSESNYDIRTVVSSNVEWIEM